MKRTGCLGLLLCTPLAAQDARVDFDGAEHPAGQHAFAHAGSRWSGGRIESEVAPGLSGSGARHYEVSASGARVEFDAPVTQVSMFYVHGFGIAPGTARAFSRDGAMLGALQSRKATTFAAQEGFVAFDTAAPIARVEFSGGAVDAVRWKAGAAATLQHGTAVNGTWLVTSSAPYLSGQGLTIEYLPENNQMFVAWFTWEAGEAPRQRWLVGTGSATADGAQLQLHAPAGGRFNAASAVQQPVVGTARLTFTACDAAELQFTLPGEGGSGTLPLRSARALLAGYDCD